MTQLENELQKIKQSAMEMMTIVRGQLLKDKEALMTNNRELALEVMHNEKRINGYELMIDNQCENLIACFNPVAIDLRFVLATLKINYHLERIGDNCDGIARNVMDLEENWNIDLVKSLEMDKAFDIASDMMDDIIQAFTNENSTEARMVFEKDKGIDQITIRALTALAKHLKEKSLNVEKDLYFLLIHRKLERLGDLIKNISEEIIFYLEAKVLKHNGIEGETNFY